MTPAPGRLNEDAPGVVAHSTGANPPESLQPIGGAVIQPTENPAVALAPEPLSDARIRDMYTWAYAWRTEDGEDDTDLSHVRAANRAVFDRWLEAHDAALLSAVPEPSATPTAVSPHFIVWELDRDSVRAHVVCDDEDCIDRYACPQQCEDNFDMRREPDGTVTHAPWEDDTRAVINRHAMVKGDYCNVCEWLNADPWVLPEMNEDQSESFEIGRTAITPAWQGSDDAPMWKRATGDAAGVL